MANQSKLVQSRKSVFWYRDLVDDPTTRKSWGRDRALYCHMLLEDVRHSILPYRPHPDSPFMVSSNPRNTVGERYTARALAREGGYDLQSAASEFIRMCAQTVLAYGEAAYEIVFLSDPDTEQIQEFNISFIPSGTVRRRGGEIVQYIPPGVAERLQVPSSVPIPADRVLIFAPPTELSSILSDTMDALEYLSHHDYPPFSLPDPQGRSNSIPFDMSLFLRTQTLAIAAACKEIGWDARRSSLNETLEFYDLLRELKFNLFLCKLRDELIQTLNVGLERVHLVLPNVHPLLFGGLPTSDDVHDAMDRLRAGSVNLRALMAPFRAV